MTFIQGEPGKPGEDGKPGDKGATVSTRSLLSSEMAIIIFQFVFNISVGFFFAFHNDGLRIDTDELSVSLPNFQGETGKQGPVGAAGPPGIQARHL